MNKNTSSAFSIRDILFAAGIVLFFLPFFVFEAVLQQYQSINAEFPVLMSFFKFAVLATLGEVIGLRIKSGAFNQPGFGILPRAVVWGFLGITIHVAFSIFPSGVIHFLETHGLSGSMDAFNSEVITTKKAFTALSISVLMNLIYAPWLMTLHKITDTHIEIHSGSLKALVRPIKFGQILSGINWNVHWNFVLLKTIPLFWMPAHTITFLLPEASRVLFAALLGIMLGVFLAVASVMGKKS